MTILPSDGRERLEIAAKPQSNRLLWAIRSLRLNGLLTRFETVALHAGDHLYEAGWANQYVYFPHTAVISHTHNSESGESIEIAMVGFEGVSGICGWTSRQAPIHSAIVCFSGTAARIELESLLNEVRRNERVQRVLFDYAMWHLSQVSQRVVCHSFHLAEGRFAAWLLMLHDRVATDRIRITHEQISGYVAVNRSTVTIIAKKFRDEGVIDYMRGKLHIIDRAALERAACECFTALGALEVPLPVSFSSSRGESGLSRLPINADRYSR